MALQSADLFGDHLDKRIFMASLVAFEHSGEPAEERPKIGSFISKAFLQGIDWKETRELRAKGLRLRIQELVKQEGHAAVLTVVKDLLIEFKQIDMLQYYTVQNNEEDLFKDFLNHLDHKNFWKYVDNGLLHPPAVQPTALNNPFISPEKNQEEPAPATPQKPVAAPRRNKSKLDNSFADFTEGNGDELPHAPNPLKLKKSNQPLSMPLLTAAGIGLAAAGVLVALTFAFFPPASLAFIITTAAIAGTTAFITAFVLSAVRFKSKFSKERSGLMPQSIAGKVILGIIVLGLISLAIPVLLGAMTPLALSISLLLTGVASFSLPIIPFGLAVAASAAVITALPPLLIRSIEAAVASVRHKNADNDKDEDSNFNLITELPSLSSLYGTTPTLSWNKRAEILPKKTATELNKTEVNLYARPSLTIH